MGLSHHRGIADSQRCRRREWHGHLQVETVRSLLTAVCHIKQRCHCVGDCFRSHLGDLMALCNLLAQWHGLQPDDYGVVRLSIAQCSL